MKNITVEIISDSTRISICNWLLGYLPTGAPHQTPVGCVAEIFGAQNGTQNGGNQEKRNLQVMLCGHMSIKTANTVLHFFRKAVYMSKAWKRRFLRELLMEKTVPSWPGSNKEGVSYWYWYSFDTVKRCCRFAQLCRELHHAVLILCLLSFFGSRILETWGVDGVDIPQKSCMIASATNPYQAFSVLDTYPFRIFLVTKCRKLSNDFTRKVCWWGSVGFHRPGGSAASTPGRVVVPSLRYGWYVSHCFFLGGIKDEIFAPGCLVSWWLLDDLCFKGLRYLVLLSYPFHLPTCSVKTTSGCVSPVWKGGDSLPGNV